MHNEEKHGNEETRDEESKAEQVRTDEETQEESAAQDTVTEEPESGEEEQVASKAAESEDAEAGPQGIVGIRFEPCGKVYCFKSNGMGLKRGERVVVESDLGVSIGRVVVEDEAQMDPGKQLKPVLRRVTEEDLRQEEENKTLKQEAFDFCNERIMARGLAMKLLGTDITLDKKRIVFFFSAETRIDFRELVKDLAAKFRTRIELRQVGVRDAARITGGLGVCGRELCCRRFLTSFLPISIKMAKKQELALNTSKLSGICGRLMCCLGYEYEEKLKELKKKDKKETEEKKVEEPAVEEQPPVSEPVREEPVQPEPATELKEGEAPPRKRRRRRRRRPGRRPGDEAQKGQEQKTASAEKPAEAKASGEKPSEEKPAEGASPVKKPFKRKRRRRRKGKKKE